MKRKTMILVACLVLGIVGVVGTVMAAGPAPNAGDCIADGSGSEIQVGPNGEGYGPGPAPNSGDGIPDGPGWP